MFSFFLNIPMYSTILQVAHDIILIGGALMIILGVILLAALLVIAVRVNKVVTKSIDTVETVSQYIMLPFTYLAGIFAGKGDADDEKPVRKRTASRKK